MSKDFKKLLENTTGKSQYIIAIVLDIRGFTPFCQTIDSVDVATYIKKVYMKIIEDYFPNASFYKPTGDGLLITIPYEESTLKEVANETIMSCLNLLRDFCNLCKNEVMITFDTPKTIGIGITRGSACCIISGEKIFDYSGKALNLASRLMDVARPSGIVIDSNFNIELLEEKIRNSFSKDDVYVRGIAEEKPLTVYYTKNTTLIPRSFKQPIKEPKWETVNYKMTLKKFKSYDTQSLSLEHKPLDENLIAIEVGYYEEDKSKTFWEYGISHEGIAYITRGGKYRIQMKTQGISKTLESSGVTEDTNIVIDITYPVI